MISKRQRKLLELLTLQDEFQTVEFFANKLGVSKRTVYTELNMLEEYILSSGKYLEKKRGVGIALKNRRNKVVFENEKDTTYYTTATRRIEIMKMMLFDEEIVSYNNLSELFMVSKTSITKDFEAIMSILNPKSNDIVKSNAKGTKICGNEVEVQKAYLRFNNYLLSNSDLYLKDTITEQMKLLDIYYGDRVINACLNILYTYIRQNVDIISDYYLQNILNVFVINVYRNLKGHHVESEKDLISNEYLQFFEESAVRLLHTAALRLEFSYTNGDVEYLSQHLVSNRFESFPKRKIDSNIVNTLLNQVSEALKINFSKDKELEEQLRNHIPPMIYRLRSNKTIENVFTDQVKTEFPLTFNVIWVVLSEFESKLKVVFSEDEIAFLTIYFQSAIERAKLNRKILIVCQMGIATSELLMNRIKNVIPSLDSVDIASVPELEHLDLAKYELIITTIKLSISNDNVVLVSPLLNDEDIKKINKTGYKLNQVSKINSEMKAHHLEKYLNPEMISIDTNFTSRDELLSNIGKKLVYKNIVSYEFIPSLIKREEIGGTDLPSGTAVPHGNPMHVNQTTVVLVKNQKKFRWDKYYVDIIFIICISQNDTLSTRGILSDIYNILDNTRMLDHIRKMSSGENLLEGLRSE